jgi:hypothetical protein
VRGIRVARARCDRLSGDELRAGIDGSTGIDGRAGLDRDV